MKAQEAYEKAIAIQKERMEIEKQSILKRIQENIEKMEVLAKNLSVEMRGWLLNEGYILTVDKQDSNMVTISWNLKGREKKETEAFYNK